MVIIFDTLSQGINCSSFKSKLLIPIPFVKASKFTVLPLIENSPIPLIVINDGFLSILNSQNKSSTDKKIPRETLEIFIRTKNDLINLLY